MLPDLLDALAGRVVAIHYADLYGKKFEDFRKRYKDDPDRRSLYCQFHNHARDPLDRVPFPNPDHADPAAVYAYPLEYVIKYPADVWYGVGSKYLRVLRKKAKKVLWLPSLRDARDAAQTLADCTYGLDTGDKQPPNFIHWIYRCEEWIARVLKEGKRRIGGGQTRYAKAFFLAIQQRGPKDATIITATEQTARFRKAGYDAVEDDASTNKQAVINSREPQQILFLTRQSFEVVETIDMFGKSDHAATTWNTDHFERKLAADIATMMDDRLAEGPERANLWGESYWWTRKGRRIQTFVQMPASYYENKQMGEKKHRAYKLKTPHFVDIKVQTEVGQLTGKLWSDDRVKTLLRDLAGDWERLQASPQAGWAWAPQTRKSYQDAAEQERKQRVIDNALREDGWKTESLHKVVLPSLKRLGIEIKYEIPADAPLFEMGVYNRMQRFFQLFQSHREKESIEQSFDRAFESVWDAEDTYAEPLKGLKAFWVENPPPEDARWFDDYLKGPDPAPEFAKPM